MCSSTSESYSARIGGKDYPDIAWVYAAPAFEFPEIAGRLAFFNERVDGIFVDGMRMAKPKTPRT